MCGAVAACQSGITAAHKSFFTQHRVVGLLSSARDRIRPSLLDMLFSDFLGPAAVVKATAAAGQLPKNDNDNNNKHISRSNSRSSSSGAAEAAAAAAATAAANAAATAAAAHVAAGM